jgi:hypothetical protein
LRIISDEIFKSQLAHSEIWKLFKIIYMHGYIIVRVASSHKTVLLPPVMIAYDHAKEDWRNKNITPRITLRAPTIPHYGMTSGTGLRSELEHNIQNRCWSQDICAEETWFDDHGLYSY